MGIGDSIGNWYNECRYRTQEHGVHQALRWAGWHIGYKLPHRELGIDIFRDPPIIAEDWDVAIILDACRPDALDTAREAHSWLAKGSTRWSVGGMSSQWMDRTFDHPDYDLSDIGYITGNPYSRDHVDESRFAFVDEVWRDSWDEEVGTIRARPITDRAIAAGREGKADRLMVHYMQPHFPSVPESITDGISLSVWGEEAMSVWDNIAEGELTLDEAWDAYLANLEYVLDDVNLLLSNIDAETAVITADHGEGFGEQGTFGHGESPVPVLRRVPWIETSAQDSGTHQPETYTGSDVSASVEDRLKQLGYK